MKTYLSIHLLSAVLAKAHYHSSSLNQRSAWHDVDVKLRVDLHIDGNIENETSYSDVQVVPVTTAGPTPTSGFMTFSSGANRTSDFFPSAPASDGGSVSTLTTTDSMGQLLTLTTSISSNDQLASSTGGVEPLSSLVASSPSTLQPAYTPIALEVQVGTSQFLFNPRNVTAQAGDLIRFVIPGSNVTIAQTTLEDPCTPVGTFKSPHGHQTVDYLVKSTAAEYFHGTVSNSSVCLNETLFALNAADTVDQFFNNAL